MISAEKSKAEKTTKEIFTIYKGAAFFRYRLVFAILTATKIKITDIRSEEANPGITEAEANFLELLQKITDGGWVKIGKTGTKVKFRPGIIANGNGTPINHECHNSRSITYYLEGILPIILFGKENLNLTLNGVTNDNIDISIDTFKGIVPQLLTHFGLEETLIINVIERGIYPLGGGKVNIKCPIVNKLEPINLVEEGKVKRIRGTAYACKTSPQLCNRIFETMRGVFIDFIPDVWIHTDHSKSGLSPGYGSSVIAETTTGILISADSMYNPQNKECTPESIGKETALRLLDEIMFGGCVDSSFQALVLALMALSSSEHVASLKVGRVTKYSYFYNNEINIGWE